MKVTISRDEWYPVYDLDKDISYESAYTFIVKISSKFWDEYIEASDKFIEVQNRLRDIYNNNRGGLAVLCWLIKRGAERGCEEGKCVDARSTRYASKQATSRPSTLRRKHNDMPRAWCGDEET